jgi:hypothetical protein
LPRRPPIVAGPVTITPLSPSSRRPSSPTTGT